MTDNQRPRKPLLTLRSFRREIRRQQVEQEIQDFRRDEYDTFERDNDRRQDRALIERVSRSRE
jgi:hypothetical protein